jgi:1-deoxy-D-xylulose-5-phosphate reductoisomerase
MGPKVTIDSATMMNKGLEVMEASWLFDMPVSKIDIVVQRESVIHSMIEYEDNSVIAQLGVPDMRIPIQYAITWPDRLPSPVRPLDLAAYGRLTFARPDEKAFSCLAACRCAMARGGLAPAAANGANEVAVRLFLDRRVSFPEIGILVQKAIDHQPDLTGEVSVSDILEADSAARAFVRECASQR